MSSALEEKRGEAGDADFLPQFAEVRLDMPQAIAVGSQF